MNGMEPVDNSLNSFYGEFASKTDALYVVKDGRGNVGLL
jgi:hypothetical protein